MLEDFIRLFTRLVVAVEAIAKAQGNPSHVAPKADAAKPKADAKKPTAAEKKKAEAAEKKKKAAAKKKAEEEAAAAEEEEDIFGGEDETEEVPTYTREDAKAALLAVNKKHGKQLAVSILSGEFEAKNISSLSEDVFPGFIQRCEQAIEAGE